MKTCLIDAAYSARKTGSESRVLDALDIGAKGGFSKVCSHFRMEEEHGWPARPSGQKNGTGIGTIRRSNKSRSGGNKGKVGEGVSPSPFGSHMDACLASHYIEISSGACHGQSARPLRPAGAEAAYITAFDVGDDPYRLSQPTRTVGRADLQ
jgi:hypothetical protein